MKRTLHLRCYAHGGGDSWEAICVDLDLAVQGSSRDEVRQMLKTAIRMYVETASQQMPAVRDRLLARKSPLHVRTYLAFRLMMSMAFARFNGEDGEGYTVPCPA